jgi:hypothetical protein
MTESSDLQNRINDTHSEISRLQRQKRDLEERALYQGTVRAVELIFKIVDNFSYLWEEGAPLHGEELHLISYWAAQDDLERMWVERKEGGLHFKTNEGGDYSSVEEVSRAIIDMNYRDPIKLLKVFKDALKKPLGEYLAERELGKF